VSEHWKQRPEGGSRFAIWLIRSIASHGGRWLGRLLLYPITLYFVLVRGPERRASRDFLTRLHGRPARLTEVLRHIHCFASTILDRVFMLSGQFRSFDLRISGLEALHAEIDKGEGVLLFGSHLGSFEALRVLARERPDVVVRVVMDRGQNAAVTSMLEALCPDIAATVIDATQDGASIALAIKQATDAGALVGLLVDRARPGDPLQRVPLLGAAAPFPNAPFLIAATLGVPVVLSFGLYRGGRRYDLHFEPFAIEHNIPRATARGAARDADALRRATRALSADRALQLVQLLRLLEPG
jgi:predicted LPLAT superfamily acyltransferase